MISKENAFKIGTINNIKLSDKLFIIYFRSNSYINYEIQYLENYEEPTFNDVCVKFWITFLVKYR